MSLDELMEQPPRLSWRERLVWTAVAVVLLGAAVVVVLSGPMWAWR